MRQVQQGRTLFRGWKTISRVFVAIAVAGICVPSTAHLRPVIAEGPEISQLDGPVNVDLLDSDGMSLPQSPLADPSYLADKARMAFQSNRDGNWEIYVGNGIGANPIRITLNAADDIRPRLNRGATQVVFVSNRDGNNEIYAVNVDGSNLRRLTNNADDDTDPMWSPDSSKIAFTSARDGQPEIYVMNADGSAQQRLTYDAAIDSQPAWSPDAARIAFVAHRAGPSGSGGRVWLMNADGSNPVILSADFAWSAYPVWSPDGGRIAFSGYAYGDQWADAIVINADGTSPYVAQFGSSANQIMWEVDAFSLDGQWLGVSRWDYLTGNTLESSVIWYIPLDGQFHGYQITADNAGFNRSMDTQPVTILPPTTTVQPLPTISPADFTVSVSGTLSTGVASNDIKYEVQVRTGLTGTWTTLAHIAVNAPKVVPFHGKSAQQYFFRSRGTDSMGNMEAWPPDADAWTTVESEPPHSQLVVTSTQLPATELQIRWQAVDVGGSAIAAYDIDYRVEPTTTWTHLFSQTVMTSTVFPIVPTAVYHFRVRATDAAGNLEPWPANEGDSAVFPIALTVLGHVHDSVGNAVSSSTTSLGSGTRSSTSSSDAFGDFSGSIRPAEPAITITVSKPGYGPLPATRYLPEQASGNDYYLPPVTNIVANWGFEQPLELGAWTSTDFSAVRADVNSRHTGALGLTIGGAFFGSPTNVSVSASDSSGPALATGVGQTLHAAWFERTGSSIELYSALRSSSGVWTAPHGIFGNLAPSDTKLPAGYRPELATDNTGRDHIVWRSWPDGNVYYAVSDPGTGWLVYLVASSLEEGALPRMAVEPGGTAHISWHAASPSRTDVYYLRRSSSGLWSAPENVTGSNPYLTDARNPAIAVDITGTVYLAWENGTGFLSQRPISGTWAPPTAVFAWPFSLSRPQLVVDASGAAHSAWQANFGSLQYGVAYARYRNGLETQPILVDTDPSPITLKDLATDAAGRPHLAWAINAANVFHGVRAIGGAWTVTRLTSPTAVSGAAASLAPAGSNVWMAWRAQNLIGVSEGGCSRWSEASGWLDFGRCALPWPADPALVAEPDGRVNLLYTPEGETPREIWHLSWLDGSPAPSQIAQRMTIPITMSTPGLSFLYRIDGSPTDAQAAFTVTAETDLGATVVYTSLETPGTDWKHIWRDMSAFAGSAITLSFAIDPRDGSGGARLALDEVSLGSTAPDLWVNSWLPPELRPGTTLTMAVQYGNQGGGTAAGTTLSMTVPAGLTFVGAEPPPSTVAPNLVWTPNTLASGAVGSTIVLTFTVGASAPGVTITPTLVIAGTTSELELANNTWRVVTGVGYRAFLPRAVR